VTRVDVYVCKACNGFPCYMMITDMPSHEPTACPIEDKSSDIAPKWYRMKEWGLCKCPSS